MRRPAIALLAVILAVGACGDDDGAATSTSPTTVTSSTGVSTTDAPTTTAPPVTLPPTTSAPETTTTAAPTTTGGGPYVIDPGDLFPDVFPGSADAHGSGCVTGQDTLPDGVWFGFVTAASGANHLSFDLACFYTGAAGIAAATADGEVGYDLEFYIRNNNPKLYPVALDPGGTAWYISTGSGGVEPLPVAASAWPVGAGYVPCPGEFCAVWLYVNGGIATGLVEQYLP